ncbi:unnamed protein product [Phytophthora fragariaefolia]|uniref:Unnamed protein product n=1 Tax=Phytophthora fragariaefolia TaxID=1490495 RepID=A0A9W7CX55_9STRA|nr:unnamed protein product [Phytophthora fragariaefolia]
MTPRAREISAFITPFGLFKWLCMPFGLKNAPQIYQRLVDNALYGHLKISANSDSALPIDVFKYGEPETNQEPSVLGRRSYIDDILVTASDWDVLCEKVEKLLDACDRWNLSISVVKSFGASAKLITSVTESTVLDDNRGERAMVAFTMLKATIASTPILRNFDPDRAPVVVVYSSLGSSPDIGCLLYSSGNEVDQGADSAFDVGVVGEDEILGTIAASITHREEVDEVLTAIDPKKQPHQTVSIPPPTVELDEHLLVVSLDGSARAKRGGFAYGAII